MHLRPQSYEVLKYLGKNNGRLVSKDELIEAVWQGRAVTDDALVQCLVEVRQALGAKGKLYVRNVRGRGYIFDPVDGDLVGKGDPDKLPSDATDFLAPTATSAVQAATGAGHGVSNAEPFLSRVKRHKRQAAVWSALAIAAIVAGFAYFKPFAATAPAINSIAVLPFANATGNPEMEYLSDGIGENLINSLSQLPQLKVIARSSSFRYKGKVADSQEVARALNVRAILTGRVSQRGDDLVVNVELTDAQEGTQVWGEQFTRKPSDIQTMEEEIARTVANKLRLRLSPDQQQQFTRFATQNPNAYQAYLNGMFYMGKGGFENVRRALDFFNQAVALDPNSALAWVGISKAYRDLQAKSLLDPKIALTRAKAAAQKALELDDTLPDAHLALGRIKHDEWDLVGAEREYKRAIELSPNMAEAHAKYCVYLSAVGRHAEAVIEDKRAQELDPLQSDMRGWGLLYAARRYDELIEKLQRAIRLQPDVGLAHGVLALSYDAKGMYEQAIIEHHKWISIDGETTSILCYLGHSLAMSGKRKEAMAILKKLKTTKEYVAPAELSALYVGLGDKERALMMLEKGYEARDPGLQNLKIDHCYDSLRSDPRFLDLMRRVGLTP